MSADLMEVKLDSRSSLGLAARYETSHTKSNGSSLVQPNRIAIVGSGYVGLVTGACFAEVGHTVRCIDSDADKINKLQAGTVPFYEPGLADVVQKQSQTGRLQFTCSLAEGISGCDFIFLAVGTPSRRIDGHADLSFIYAASREIAEHLESAIVVAVKSTVPVGTSDEIERIIGQGRGLGEASVVSNPEFLREGSALHDFRYPDRVVIGAEDKAAQRRMVEIYRSVVLNTAPLLCTRRRSAELIKCASNAFLATKVAFINEIADLCENCGADITEVAQGIGLDNRIGEKFFAAGPGFGGSCFPKDSLAIIKAAHDYRTSLGIVEAVVAVNDRRRRTIVHKVVNALNGRIRGAKVAVLGLTFKPNTDDVRESPAISLIVALQDLGAVVHAYDPQGMDSARSVLNDVSYCTDVYAATADAEVCVIVTDWEEFRLLDFLRLKDLMAKPIIVDLRNLLDPESIIGMGFDYHGVGRTPSQPSGANPVPPVHDRASADGRLDLDAA